MYAEYSRNVSLLGQEFFKDDKNRFQMGFKNRFVRDKLVEKDVVISKGYFKG